MRWAGLVERGEVHTGFWWRNLTERDELEDSGIDGSIILKWIFRKLDGGAWAQLIRLRIGTSGGLL
jgi:hypothetical protein